MSVSINFVGNRQKQLKIAQEKDIPLLKKTIIALAVTVVLTGIVLAVQFYIGFEKKQLVDSQNKIKAAIEARKETESQFALFFQKLSALTLLFGERQNKQEALVFFRNLFGAGISVTGLSYNETDQELTFSLLSPSVFSLDKVFTTLKSDSLKSKYPRIDRNNLARSDNGSYSMQLTVDLQPVKPEKPTP